jgi:hypothetical protein
MVYINNFGIKVFWENCSIHPIKNFKELAKTKKIHALFNGNLILVAFIALE